MKAMKAKRLRSRNTIHMPVKQNTPKREVDLNYPKGWLNKKYETED